MRHNGIYGVVRDRIVRRRFRDILALILGLLLGGLFLMLSSILLIFCLSFLDAILKDVVEFVRLCVTLSPSVVAASLIWFAMMHMLTSI